MVREAHRTSGVWIWVTAFILANLRGTVIWDVLKQGFGLDAIPWLELGVWLLLLIGALGVLSREHLLPIYFELWKKNSLVSIFILIALLSLTWSVFVSASLYRTGALLFSSLIGAYLGVRYSLEELLDLFFRFGTIVLILCLALALFLPVAGRMDWEPYNGAWRGFFWHKNQFGSLAALFTMVFLVRMLASIERGDDGVFLNGVFYAFSCVLIFFSDSVAGYFLVLVLTFSTLLAFAWLRTRQRLKPIHYYGALGIGAVGLALLLLNLDFVFGLFNRNTTLTGRVPLWSYLLSDVAARSPWFGHGFGALWSDREFRLATAAAVNWDLPVAIGDNGFLDILLHLGLLGLIPFLGILFSFALKSIQLVDRHGSIESFFPLLLLVYAILANISFSLFLETESFLWLVMVAVLFAVTKEAAVNQAS